MRLIDADAVAEAINDEIEITAEIGTHEANVCKGGLIMGLAYVNTAPTIDAVPVVRCKDCFLFGECKAAEWYGENGNGYCSVGDRRKDNEIDRR